MKKLIPLFILAFITHECHKSPPDLDYNITGQVVDFVSGKPVPNISLYAEKAYSACLFCDFVYTVLDREVTDAEGRFSMDYRLLQENDRFYVNLKIDAIPAGYQSGVRVENQTVGCIANHDFWEFVGFDPLEDGKFYRVELLPDAYARIIKPVIPAGWEKDTLQLHSNNVCWSWPCYESCMFKDGDVEFVLNDIEGWQMLGYPQPLMVGDLVHLSYTIRNGVVKKTGDFSIECILGDTTNIQLPLFE